MNTGTVSVRYAKALLKYAVENGEDAQVYSELGQLAKRMHSLPSIHERLSDPTVSAAHKCRLLETVVTDLKCSLSKSLTRLFKLVVDAGRGDCMVFIATSYQSLYRDCNGILSVHLTTAVPMGEERHSRLRDIVESVEHGEIEWKHTTDPKIEGGFVLQVDGYRMDASLAWQIQRIRKELIDKNNRII